MELGGLPVVIGVVAVAVIAARALSRGVLDLSENRLLARHRCQWCGAARRMHTVDEFMELDGLRVRRRAETEVCDAQVRRIIAARDWAVGPRED